MRVKDDLIKDLLFDYYETPEVFNKFKRINGVIDEEEDEVEFIDPMTFTPSKRKAIVAKTEVMSYDEVKSLIDHIRQFIFPFVNDKVMENPVEYIDDDLDNPSGLLEARTKTFSCLTEMVLFFQQLKEATQKDIYLFQMKRARISQIDGIPNNHEFMIRYAMER